MNWTDEQLDATEAICNAATESLNNSTECSRTTFDWARIRILERHARTALPSAVAEMRRLRRERRHWARVAEWFADNEPGTPVPDWCFMGWCNGEPLVDEEILVESEAAEAAKEKR